MTLTEIVGWLAAALTLATFSMKTMIWLRGVAIGSNCAFIVYSLISSQYPILILHSIMLPFNSVRLYQAWLARTHSKTFQLPQFDRSWIQDLAKIKTFPEGAVVFERGDEPRFVYFIVKGKVLVVDANVVLGEA